MEIVNAMIRQIVRTRVDSVVRAHVAVFLILFSSQVAAQHFRCDNAETAERRWQTVPCEKGWLQREFETAPGTPSKAEQKRQDEAQVAADNELYEKYRAYCRELGHESYSSSSSCASEHMDGIRFARKIRSEHAEGTDQRKRLDGCLGRHYNKVTDYLDARMVKYCYLSP